MLGMTVSMKDPAADRRGASTSGRPWPRLPVPAFAPRASAGQAAAWKIGPSGARAYGDAVARDDPDDSQ